ncbi:MAG: 50S ribosomal protein L10 [Halobacteriales archaeon]
MSADRRTETIPEWKREEVAELVEFVAGYESIGVVDITGIPSRQLQDMRADLHGEAELRMSRNTLLRRALEEAGEDVAVLADRISGHVGLVGTDANPFTLFRRLEDSKTSAPINAGEVAPNDITVPEGDTGMDPGPFVGELQNVGAAAQIMEGSIQVTEDSVVAEAGDVVSDDLANVLSELGIEPKEVGLDLRAVVSDGILFDPEDLAVDVEAYRADVEAAAAGARNLAVNAAYPTDATAGALLGKASGEARSLGLHAAVESPSLADDLVARADARVRALAASIDDEEALPEELSDLEAPADEQPADQPDEPDAEAEEDAAEEEDAEADDDGTDDDDDDAAAEGLGDMFG